MKEKLSELYNTLGERGTMFILYALSLVTNSLISAGVTLPAMYPEELNVAGIAAFYSGRNWSDLLSITGGEGYIQALFYAPLFLIFKNPYVIYKAMLIINALLISFIPVIAYYLAAKLGVEPVYQKMLIALCCGMYASYISNSKFIWNESITSVLGWVIVLCLMSSWDKKIGGTRIIMSALTGFLCALSYAANPRLAAVVAAVILTIIFVRVFFGEYMVNVPVFAVTLVLSFAVERFVAARVKIPLWGSGHQSLTFVSLSDFFGELFSQLYAFMTSTLGFGAIAAAVFLVTFLAFVREGFKKCKLQVLENGTKVYEPIKHKYSEHIAVFALFQFFVILCMAIITAMFSHGTAKAEAGIFGHYMDSAAPLAVFTAMVFIFLYDLNWLELLLSAGIYAYTCFCFAVMGFSKINTGDYLLGAISEMFPVRVKDAEITNMTFVIMSSCVFSVFAILMVFTSCAKHHGKSLISASMLVIAVYSTVYTGAVYIPRVGRENLENIEDYLKIADYLYNDPQSPQIVVYNTDMELAAVAQFLNPDTKVCAMPADSKFPEACLILAENGVTLPIEGGFYDSVGKTDKFTLYTFGEAARDFYRYSSSGTREPER